MTYKNMIEMIENLGKITLQPIYFNELKIEINEVLRAYHPTDWNIKPHHHPWFELNYIQSGSLYNTIDDVEFLAKEGESYIVNPGVKHSHINNKTGDDGICIRFTVENTNKNNLENENLIKAMQIQPKYSFDSGFERFSPQRNEITLKAEFVNLLMKMYDKKGYFVTQSNNPPPTLSNQVIKYLAEYYREKIYISDIARALNISYRTLSRKFKEETGITISDKLTQIRITAAKKLLLESNMLLYDIATQTGFENEYYFSNAFKKAEGISPSFYRKQKSPLY